MIGPAALCFVLAFIFQVLRIALGPFDALALAFLGLMFLALSHIGIGKGIFSRFSR
jgi:hypothetical protein